MAVNQEIKGILKMHHTKMVSSENFLGVIWILIHVKEPEKNTSILLYLSICFSLYIWFTNTDGFTLQRKFFSHFLLVEDFISCTFLKIHRKIKKNLCAAIYHHVGTSSAYAQCFKTASAMGNCACSIYYWPALTLQSPGKTHRWNLFPLLVCTKAAPLCTVHSWRIFKIKASCLSTILLLACHARPFSLWVLWCSSGSQEK